MPEFPARPTETEADVFRRRRRGRNKAIIMVLVGLALLFYAITIVKMVRP